MTVPVGTYVSIKKVEYQLGIQNQANNKNQASTRVVVPTHVKMYNHVYRPVLLRPFFALKLMANYSIDRNEPLCAIIVRHNSSQGGSMMVSLSVRVRKPFDEILILIAVDFKLGSPRVFGGGCSCPT